MSLVTENYLLLHSKVNCLFRIISNIAKDFLLFININSISSITEVHLTDIYG